MKANELMIGDWVMLTDPIHQGEKEQVKAIPDDGHIIVDGGIMPMFEPIPLTAEILKKNFVKIGTNRYVVYGGNSYIKDMTNFFELHINFVDFKLEQQIFYVHKLQHALRLCGIEKEIEL